MRPVADDNADDVSSSAVPVGPSTTRAWTAGATRSAALVFWGHLSSNGPATSPRPSTETNTTGKVLGPHDGESACDQHSAEDQPCLRSKLQLGREPGEIMGVDRGQVQRAP